MTVRVVWPVVVNMCMSMVSRVGLIVGAGMFGIDHAELRRADTTSIDTIVSHTHTIETERINHLL